jgi:AraC-like DNA-binding protein
MLLNLTQIASFIAMFQSVFMGVFFIKYKKDDRISNKILAFLLFTFALLIGTTLFRSRGVPGFVIKYYEIYFVISQFGFLIGPLLYFYIRSLLEQNFRFKKQYGLHFIPFILIIGYVILYLIQDNNYRTWRSPLSFFCSTTILIQNLFYFIISMQLLKRNGLSFKSFFSFVSDTKLAWLRFFIIGYIVIWFTKLQGFIVYNIFLTVKWCPYTSSLYFLVSCVFVNTIVSIALNKPNLFISNRKYERSVLTESDKKQYQKKLLSFLENQKPYFDSTLSLTDLSKKMSIPMRSLSQIINESFNKNYYDFINSYRIKESKRIMMDKSNGKKTVLEIAYHVGFNSKSTFNSAFKKLTGMTPKEYRKKISSTGDTPNNLYP